MRWYLLLFIPFVCGFQITEVMYDPEGNDNNHEYVEVFTNGTNLTDVFFEDLASSDPLTLVQYFDGPYALLVEEGFNATAMNVTIYTTGATLGNGLNNDKELVLFRTNESVLDAVFYVASRDGGNDGKSLCVVNHVLIPCTPSPGQDNDLNTTSSDQNITLQISEFLPDPAGDDRASRPQGEWVELYNFGEKAVDLRGLEIQDARNTTFIISDVHLEKPILEPKQYGVVYFNGRSLLNNEGFEIVRLATETQNLDEVSYSSSKEGLSWAKNFVTGDFVLSVPTPGVPYLPQEVSLNSSLVLERAYMGNDDVVRFGESFRVRLQVYKGDTEKTTVKVFVENLSKQTTISVDEKFVNHTFVLTIPLLPNCHGKLSDGTYIVHAEGLDAETTLPIKIQGTSKDDCVIVNQEVSTEKVSLKASQKPLAFKNAVAQQPSDTFINISGAILYESSDYKAKRWAVYFFCFTLLLVIAALQTQD